MASLPSISRDRASAARAASSAPPSPRMIDDEAEEVNEGEAQRDGAESPTGTIDTQVMTESWLRALRLPAANEADEAEQEKLRRWAERFAKYDAIVREMQDAARDPTTIPAQILSGRQVLTQRTTSVKGVLERTRTFETSYAKMLQNPSSMLHQAVLFKKDLSDTMEKKAKLNETKMLHRAQEREAQRREEERMRDQEDEMRRALGSPMKKARLEMKVAAIQRERNRGAAADEAFTLGVWDRAAVTEGSPLKRLAAPENAPLLMLRSPAPSSVSGSLLSPLPGSSHAGAPRGEAAASASGPAVGPSPSKRHREDDSDPVIPLSQARASPAAPAAAAASSSASGSNNNNAGLFTSSARGSSVPAVAAAAGAGGSDASAPLSLFFR